MICAPPPGVAASDFARYLLVRVQEIWPKAYGEHQGETACPHSSRMSPDLDIHPDFASRQSAAVFRMQPRELVEIRQTTEIVTIHSRGLQALKVYEHLQSIPVIVPLIRKEMACASTP